MPAQESAPGTFEPLPAGDAETAAQASEPAVVALLDESERKLRAGEQEAAAASVERALRISPGNALLWYRLAAIRIGQRQWSQAEALAQKSLSLGGGDRRLQQDNWQLIAQARRELGDAAGARAAENAAARSASAVD
jgi:predicted Zn-dependent protease